MQHTEQPGDDHPLLDEVAAILELRPEQRADAFERLRVAHPDERELLVAWELAALGTPEPGATQSDVIDPASGAPAGRVATGTPASAASPSSAGALGPSVAQPEWIGPYRVLELLGAGGMGQVFLAEQREPVRRRLAVKIIRLDLTSPQAQARFDLERQALALMSHEAIAQVHDVGVTDEGRPYLAMEYVPGLPLHRYCDRHGLDLDARIDLIRQVVAGIEHAHQKGIVHRDLKPANILVADRDGVAAPKIIDFGLARSTDGRLATDTLFTRFQAILGTPEYMAPEQADAALGAPDTRTDVYALGVLTYEILTGRLPLALPAPSQSSWANSVTRICHETPSRPSERVLVPTDSERESPHRLESAEELARHRKTTAAGLAKRLRGDLDWIVMCALEKEPARRYASAREFAADLLRHQRSEPVLAGPPSARYRLRKLLRRNRARCLAAGIAAAGILFGTVSALVFGIEASAQARAAQRLADRNAELAEKADRHLGQFQLLRFRSQLDQAIADVEPVRRGGPRHGEELQRWIDERAKPLVGAGRRILAALGEVRERAEPPTEDDLAAIDAARREVEPLEQMLTALRAAAAARAGGPKITPAELDATDRSRTARELLDLARPLVMPGNDRSFGEEARGLALAEAAARSVAAGDASANEAESTELVAWARFAVGDDIGAQQAMRDALLASAQEARPAVMARASLLDRLIKQASEPYWSQTERRLARDLETRSRAAEATRTWRFADPADTFLHRTLAELLRDLDAFTAIGGLLEQVYRAANWARRAPRETITDLQAEWDIACREAREIPRYDGLELRPQLGLAPRGRNPVTGLLEFEHVRSATQPDKPAERGIDGHLQATDETGILFVLLPGRAQCLRGAQRNDASAPHYDPAADPGERPELVAVEPLFIALHEVTQAQWQRLSAMRNPSARPSGSPYRTRSGPQKISGAHPVESVDWPTAERVLAWHDLRLPTESEWEYAARAGSPDVWTCGSEPQLLRRFANLADQSVGASSGWDHEPWDDGFPLHAPVGSFDANRFGLRDVHGNVAEWCADRIDADRRIARGGSFYFVASYARSAARTSVAASQREWDLGLRAARSLDPGD